MGLCRVILVVFFALWQIALTGYTYVAAGHAAREGARQLAVDASDTGKDPAYRKAAGGAPRRAAAGVHPDRAPPYRKAAEADLPETWRHGAVIEKRGDVTVSVHL